VCVCVSACLSLCDHVSLNMRDLRGDQDHECIILFIKTAIQRGSEARVPPCRAWTSIRQCHDDAALLVVDGHVTCPPEGSRPPPRATRSAVTREPDSHYSGVPYPELRTRQSGSKSIPAWAVAATPVSESTTVRLGNSAIPCLHGSKTLQARLSVWSQPMPLQFKSASLDGGSLRRELGPWPDPTWPAIVPPRPLPRSNAYETVGRMPVDLSGSRFCDQLSADLFGAQLPVMYYC